MRRSSKEDYINIDSDRSSKVSKISKNDIVEMDKILTQMQTAYRANIQAQQLYIDIVKRKNKNLNSNDIKSIYALFTQNKANQICYEKQQEYFVNAEWDEKLLKRYYARVIQMGIRKISYYWMNSSYLQFLSSSVVKLMRQIYSCFNDMQRHKNLDAHFTVLKMMFRDSATIQQKIYQLLIDEGYLLSMDQFYRINGVDLVDDQQYESKKDKSLSPSVQDSEEQTEEKKPSSKFIKTSKHKIPKQTRRWGYSKPVAQSFTITPTQVEKNKSKIKTMIQSLVTVIKSSIQQEKQQKENINFLEVIQEETDGIPPQSQRNNKPESSKQLLVNQQNKSRKRVSKPENILVNEFKKRTNQKKMSIQLMSYFSNQFKSAISETQQVDIECLSQFLMTSESNSKQLPLTIGKNNNEPYIHSLQSLQSMKRIKQQKKRGKLIQMAFLKKHNETLSQMCEQLNENCSMNFSGKSKMSKHKFSFKSAPGVYITLPKKADFFSKNLNRNYNKVDFFRNRFIIKQNYEKDQIFQNELIVNELTSQQMGNKFEKIDFTQVNGDSLKRGILGAQNLFSLNSKEISLNNNSLNALLNQKSQPANKDGLRMAKLKQILTQKQLRLLTKTRITIESQFRKKLPKNLCFTEEIKQNKEIRSEKSTERDLNNESNKSTQRNNVNYTVYDRIRRKIIFER